MMGEAPGLQGITFVDFVNGQHLDLFIEARGKEEIAKGAVEVLTRILAARVDYGPRLQALDQASRWQGDSSKLLQTITAYEMYYTKHMKIPDNISGCC